MPKNELGIDTKLSREDMLSFVLNDLSKLISERFVDQEYTLADNGSCPLKMWEDETGDFEPGPVVKIIQAETPNKRHSFFYVRAEWPDDREGQQSYVHFMWGNKFRQKASNLPRPTGFSKKGSLNRADIRDIYRVLTFADMPYDADAQDRIELVRRNIVLLAAADDIELVSFYNRRLSEEGRALPRANELMEEEIAFRHQLTDDEARRVTGMCIANLINKITRGEISVG